MSLEKLDAEYERYYQHQAKRDKPILKRKFYIKHMIQDAEDRERKQKAFEEYLRKRRLPED